MKVLIAHAAFLPERRAHVEKMLQTLPHAEVVSSYEPEHASVWARRLWERAAEIGGPVVCLNDDVDVCDNFEAVCDALVKAAPNRTIALHATAAVAPSLLMCKERWLASYWLTGPAYIIDDYAALLKWLDTMPSWLATSRNEDNVVMAYQWVKREPVLHCLPALVQHKTEIASTLGYDKHPMRTTDVPWTVHPLAPLDDWPSPDGCLNVACAWMAPVQFKRTEMAIRAHTEPSPEPLVAFATPSKGGTFTEEYVSSLWRTALEIRNGGMKWIALRYADDNVDIIRGRNRFSRIFLEETGCTELLWVDDDMKWTPETVVGLITACRNGKDIVGAPYPMKRVHWDRVGDAMKRGEHPETYTSDYPVHLLRDGVEQDGDCVTVRSMGMGMMCMSRRAVAAMHDEALLRGEWYFDHPTIEKTANLFGFVVDESRHLLSDSHTICHRWRGLKDKGIPWADGRIWMYCGPGCQVDHVGKHIFHCYGEGIVGVPKEVTP